MLAGLALIPVGLVVLLLVPWQNTTDEILWVALFIGFALAVAIPAAYKTWDGENEPEPLPPGPFQR